MLHISTKLGIAGCVPEAAGPHSRSSILVYYVGLGFHSWCFVGHMLSNDNQTMPKQQKKHWRQLIKETGLSGFPDNRSSGTPLDGVTGFLHLAIVTAKPELEQRETLSWRGSVLAFLTQLHQGTPGSVDSPKCSQKSAEAPKFNGRPSHGSHLG